MKQQNNLSALATVISVFFFWGFVAASNGVLIPILKKHFTLSQFASQLVDTAFYIAYFMGSIIYFVWSKVIGDPFNKYGMKAGLVLGLIISALGAFLFIPAVLTNQYMFFLVGLFVIALGFSMLQIVANPFVINLGDPAKGSFRLNLAGSINSIGTSLGPVLIGIAMFGSASSSAVSADVDIQDLKMPFTILGTILLVVAAFLAYSKLPSPKFDEQRESGLGALRYPQVWLGMAAIFIYVGVEVTIGSNLGDLLQNKDFKGIPLQQVSMFVSLYWGSLMIGRWTGAIHAFDLSKTTRTILKIIVPFVAFAVVLLFNNIANGSVSQLLIYGMWITAFIAVNFLAQEKPARMLLLFSLAAMIMMIIGLTTTGDVAMYSFISGGLFCSVMWPCIFNLAIAGLGKYTNQGSSLLVSMILGGALIPPLQGYLADEKILGIHHSYWITVICFALLAGYAVVAKMILKRQGIDYDETPAAH